MYYVAICLAVLLTGLLGYTGLILKVVVREYERGLLYRNGRFVSLLDPGVYRLARWRSKVDLCDIRLRTIVVQGQEVLSADNVGLKLSVVAIFLVKDPEKAIHSVQDYQLALYTAAQLAVRRAVAACKIDDFLNQRAALADKLLVELRPAAEAIGLELQLIDCRDIMFPGELKKVFAEVVRAQKEGQAALERARGETAALRNLANAARMIQDNPALLNLRVLQTIANISGTSGNTFVLGVPPGFIPLRQEPGRTSAKPASPDEGETGSVE